MKIHEQLGCFGYHGFGGGYLLYSAETPGPLYCHSKCPVSNECWNAHRRRVQQIVPEMCAVADEIYEDLQGPEGVKAVMKEVGQDPYLAVSAGNIQDGAHVAASGQPKDRGEHTLAWPLEPIEAKP